MRTKYKACRSWLTLVSSLALLSGPTWAANTVQADDRAAAQAFNRAYIVQMAEPSVVAYAGGAPGYAATKPGKGQKIDPNSSAVMRYKAYLASR